MHAPTRRTFLGAGLAGVAAAGLTACQSEAPSADPSPTPTGPTATPSATSTASSFDTGPEIPAFDPTDWESVRAQFPLDASKSQFAAFVLSPHTAQVDAAVDYHRRRLAFDTEQTLLDGFQIELAIQQAAADYVGGSPGQYALTDSTIMGIASMYGGLSLRPGDEVLSTTHDFFSTEESLRLLERRTGATVRRVTLYDNRWSLDQAFAFHQGICRAVVVQRTVEQATQLKEGVASAVGADKVRVVTPLDPDVSAGIVCFDVAGLPPGNGMLDLREQGIVSSVTPYQKSYLRLGPSIVTTPEQVDAAVEAVAALGG